MKKSKLTIVILSILLAISLLGNIVLIISGNNTNKEVKEEYNPDLKYVGKWEYGYNLSTRISESVIEIDEKLNVTMTDTAIYGKLYATETGDALKDITTFTTIYKGKVKDNTIIFKEKIDKDGNKKEIREIHNIKIYDEDTLAYYSGRDNNETLYIKK